MFRANIVKENTVQFTYNTVQFTYHTVQFKYNTFLSIIFLSNTSMSNIFHANTFVSNKTVCNKCLMSNNAFLQVYVQHNYVQHNSFPTPFLANIILSNKFMPKIFFCTFYGFRNHTNEGQTRVQLMHIADETCGRTDGPSVNRLMLHVNVG